jgi:hypothetical protein
MKVSVCFHRQCISQHYLIIYDLSGDRLCGLVVRGPGYRSRGPGSIPGSTRFPEKSWVWNGVHRSRTQTMEFSFFFSLDLSSPRIAHEYSAK